VRKHCARAYAKPVFCRSKSVYPFCSCGWQDERERKLDIRKHITMCEHQTCGSCLNDIWSTFSQSIYFKNTIASSSFTQSKEQSSSLRICDGKLIFQADTRSCRPKKPAGEKEFQELRPYSLHRDVSQTQTDCRLVLSNTIRLTAF
jgi:hypothetical protein